MYSNNTTKNQSLIPWRGRDSSICHCAHTEPAPVQLVSETIFQQQSRGDTNLTIHLHLWDRLIMHGTINPLSNRIYGAVLSSASNKKCTKISINFEHLNFAEICSSSCCGQCRAMRRKQWWRGNSVEGNFKKLCWLILEVTVRVSDTVRFHILDAVKFRGWCSGM
jgi:hypothetical protein